MIKPPEGGPPKKCNKSVIVALQAVKCSCDKFHCRQHYDVVAHDCPNKIASVRQLSKSHFTGGPARLYY